MALRSPDILHFSSIFVAHASERERRHNGFSLKVQAVNGMLAGWIKFGAVTAAAATVSAVVLPAILVVKSAAVFS